MMRGTVQTQSPTMINIRPGVWLATFENQYHLTSTFMRLQEFYESPLPGIRGRFFSHEQYMDTYAASRPHGRFTYFDDWSGFNVPGPYVRRFHRLFRRWLWKKEKGLFSLIRNSIPNWDRGGRYYLIGVEKHDQRSLQHELAHAYWYLSSRYRRKYDHRT